MARIRGSQVLVLLLAAGGLAEPAGARTFGSVTRRCPFTGTTFSANVDASGTRFCQRLDFKPVGAIGAPPEVPVCPDHGFVVYQEEFSEAEIAKLRPWVESPEFRELARAESTYYRIAETLRRLGAPHGAVAWNLVQASWQVERDAEKYARYVSLALAALDEAAADPLPAEPEAAALPREIAATLAGELERRMGRFDEARQRFLALQQGGALPENLTSVVDWELELVAARDASAHYFPRDQEERCRRWD